ncbi:hypothetical protein JCM10449v2_003496 [Rhodotorula kratochvilovae]
MPAASSQKCLVCGTATANVCSSCRKAGIDLHFCSPACQKLVWSQHKHVCGPGKAMAFVWPPLGKEEAAVAIKHRKDQVLPDGSLEAAFQRLHGIAPAELPALINSLAGPPPSNLQDLRFRNAASVEVRYREAMRTGLVAPTDIYAYDPPRDGAFFQDVAVMACSGMRKGAFGYEEPAGRDRVLHLLVVYKALLARAAIAGRDAATQLPSLLAHARNAISLLEEALAVLPAEETRHAAMLVQNLRQTLADWETNNGF